jgi:hypothetical protein
MVKFLATLSLLVAFGHLSVIFGQNMERFAVILNKTIVEKWCPASRSPDVECPLGGDRVSIHVELGFEAVSLRYQVSGGRIIGSGKDVVWDFANSPPGLYKVTVKAKRGKTSLPSITKTIKLEECPDCDLPCTCPALVVMPSLSEVGAGDTVIFAAKVSGLDKHKITFKWKVENGKIIKGSKTNKLTVRASRSEADKKLTATVEIGGIDPICSCATFASETVDIR